MLSYFILPRPRCRYGSQEGRSLLGLAAFAAVVALAFACGGSSPRVSVMGVAPAGEAAGAVGAAEEIVVFVEVINRTGRELELARLDYELSAQPWFDARGSVPLRRAVDADSSAVVEIPVDPEGYGDAGVGARDDVAYELGGRLIAREDQGERSWSIGSSGTLRPVDGEVGSIAVRVDVAGVD